MHQGASIIASTDSTIASDSNVVHRLRIPPAYKHHWPYNMCTEVAPISNTDRNDCVHVERLGVDSDVPRDGGWVREMDEPWLKADGCLGSLHTRLPKQPSIKPFDTWRRSSSEQTMTPSYSHFIQAKSLRTKYYRCYIKDLADRCSDMQNISTGWEVEGIISAQESVAAMIKVIESKGIQHSGTLWTWENKVRPVDGRSHILD